MLGLPIIRKPPPMNIPATCLLALAFMSAASAQNAVWKDKDGNPVPETESRRSLNDLAGALLVTSDANWQEKWDTPEDTIPEFREAKSVAKGNSIFILTLFSNPKLDANAQANLACDIDITRPDGTSSMHEADANCYQGPIKGNPYGMRLALPVIGFKGDPGDPAGVWTVHIALKDKVANTVLPLKTSFILE